MKKESGDEEIQYRTHLIELFSDGEEVKRQMRFFLNFSDSKISCVLDRIGIFVFF